MPSSIVVIHLSASASFGIEELRRLLSDAGLINFLINPEQCKTAWGNILNTHLSNIGYIRTLGDATSIVFHASNDMLVRDGVEEYLESNPLLLHRRRILRGGFWWPADAALEDAELIKGIAKYSTGVMFASQIEGSQYPASLLFELIDEIFEEKINSGSQSYPKEEVLLPSLVYARGFVPSGMPYVYSEVHRFDRLLWSRFEWLPERLRSGWGLTKRVMNKVTMLEGRHQLRIEDVDAIRNMQGGGYSSTLFDGNSLWNVLDMRHVFAVKRVPRDMNSKLRKYITGLHDNS